MQITSLQPRSALPGGILQMTVEGLRNPAAVEVRIGGTIGGVVGASSTRLTVRVPQEMENGEVRIDSCGETAVARLRVGRILADGLHAVGNPVVDSEGRVYTTFSGGRGEEVPFSIFVVTADGQKEPFLADILNPTGLVMGPDGCLYISSRHTGTAYRSTLDKRVEKYAEGLGLATGLAFDDDGNLFVGDRGGIVYRVGKDRSTSVFAELEPSVSAYHFAMSADNELFVSGPTLATQDSIYKVDPEGKKTVVFRGFGRPQGMVWSPGRLLVAASYRGRKGIFSLSKEGLEHAIAAPMMVGLAYSPDQTRLFLTDSTRLFELDARGI